MKIVISLLAIVLIKNEINLSVFEQFVVVFDAVV